MPEPFANEPMDRLALMETFVRTVETGSFSAAARRLGVGQPAVSKAVAQLEAHLQTRLLLRSTRGAGGELATGRRVAVATPRYLAARGVPATPAQLAQHDPVPYRQDIDATGLPSGSGRVNAGARSPALRARPAWPDAMSSAVARSMIGWMSGGAKYGALPALKSALKASSLSCSVMSILVGG